MQVILTPTAIPNFFGVGLNGFMGAVPGPPTDLSAEWFNSVQQEIVNVIIGQGIALDALDFGQMKKALDNYAFVDPVISSSLTIDGGAKLFVESLGVIEVKSGGQFICRPGSTFLVETSTAQFTGDLIIGDADTDALIVVSTSTFQSPVFFNKDVDIGTDAADTLLVRAKSTFSEDINFGANTILGTGGTVTTGTVNADVLAVTEIRYDSIPGAPPTVNGRTSYDGRSLTIGDGTVARQYHTPKRVYVSSDDTVLASEDIAGASLSMTIGNNEWVYFRLSAAHLITGGGDTFFCRLAATNGVDSTTVLNSGDDDAATYGFTFGANGKITQSIIVRWKPTNDIAVPNNTSWTIRAVHGIAGGNTLTTSNVEIEGWYEP